MNTNNLPRLAYTKEEAAAMLGIPVSSIEWQIRKGKLPRRKISGRIRFTQDDLEKLVERSKVDDN